MELTAFHFMLCHDAYDADNEACKLHVKLDNRTENMFGIEAVSTPNLPYFKGISVRHTHYAHFIQQL